MKTECKKRYHKENRRISRPLLKDSQMHKKNLSFFTMLENEQYTTLTIINDIEQQKVEYTLNKEWSKTAVWKGQDSKGLLKKTKIIPRVAKDVQ